jgi:hypothetical protein
MGDIVANVAARAQQGERVRRIGIILPAAADDVQFQAWVVAFLQQTGTVWRDNVADRDD